MKSNVLCLLCKNTKSSPCRAFSINLLCNWPGAKIRIWNLVLLWRHCAEALLSLCSWAGMKASFFWFRSCFPPQSTNCHRKVWICQKLFALCFGSSHSRMEASPRAICCQSVCFHYSANNTMVACQPTSTISGLKSLHLWWKKGKLIHWL